MAIGRRSNRRAIRPRKPRIIILIEGQETEKQYFNALKQKSDKALDVQFKKNPADMIQCAKSEKLKNFDKDTDEVWFILDDDNRGTGYCNSINTYINTQQKGHYLCISNICFEVWLLMHFQTSELQGTESLLETSLTSALGYRYDKTKLKVGDYLTRISDALSNAQRQPTNLGSQPSRGSTHVYHLVNKLV